MTTLIERYASHISGTISCYDRIVITGTVPGICYAQGMETFLRCENIRLVDYPLFAKRFCEIIHTNIRKIAKEAGIEIDYIRSTKAVRKEERVQEVLKEATISEGIVHIFSVIEGCSMFEYRYDKESGRNSLIGRNGKCLHYYVYFLSKEFGLCYLRIPTWLPLRLQFYCNGHNWLASQLKQKGIAFTQMDNTFVHIQEWQKAQELADTFPVNRLHQELDRLAELYCPVIQSFAVAYHWSLMQVEYATDIVFKRREELAPLYDSLVHTAIHAVKPENVATFLGKKLHGNYQDEIGNNFNTRIEGTRIKHHMGPVSLKMYDKQGLVLRIETTVNDVSFFQHYRTVEHRNGTNEQKMAPMKKTIYSLSPLQEVTKAANRRYLDFLSQLADPSTGIKKVEKISQPVIANDRTYRGFNMFSTDDLALFRVMLRGEFAISGLRNAWIRRVLPGHSGAQVSRMLKRLHLHGMLKKIRNTYKYYLTSLGREVGTAALKLRELVVIPSLAGLLQM